MHVSTGATGATVPLIYAQLWLCTASAMAGKLV